DEYLELAQRKTASLFAVCMRLGAILARRSEEEESHLAAYGTNLGLAFQVIDDLLDFTSSQERLGKPIGNDLREGKETLPPIYLLRNCGPQQTQKVARVLEEGGFNSVPFEEILEMVQANGTVPATRERARRFAEAAKTSLGGLPDSQYKDALRSLPDFIIE